MKVEPGQDSARLSLHLTRRWIAVLLVAFAAALGIAGIANAASSITPRSPLQISVSGPTAAPTVTPTPQVPEPVALAPAAESSSLEFAMNSVIGRALNVPGRF